MAEAVPKTSDDEPSSARTSGERESDRAPEGPDPLIGQLIAEKFEILELLGEGAMGRIYRARHVALDREIAVKVLHKHLGGEDRVAKRFHREAKAASRLAHPNSVHIIDFGRTPDGILYIAMELLDGEDLQTILDHDHPLSPKRIGAILVPALRAVEEAHRAGVIHRDFKPDNIIVWEDRTKREHVKVCDFGIAKILDGEGNSITVDGFVCGTPQYMAPEQARGDEIDHRVDVYAAGVVLYQMLVGKVPFGGDTALGIITKHLTDEPVWPHTRAPDLGIPLSLEEIVKKAMSKDPAGRYQSAGEMADAIEKAIAALGDDATHKLGEAPFTAERAKKERRTSEVTAKTRSERAAGTPAEGGRERVVLVGSALGVILLGGIAWMIFGGAPPPATTVPPATHVAGPPATSAPPTSVVVAQPEPPPSSVVAVEPPVTDVPPAPPATEVEPSAVEPVLTGRPRPRPTSVVSAPPPTTAPAADGRSDGQRAFDEGRRLFLANDVHGAIRSFEEAARLMPNDPEVQKQLGRAYMRGGDVPRSVAAYRRYLALRPDASDRAIIEGIIAQH
jgi:serine/threonine-protein kinase